MSSVFEFDAVSRGSAGTSSAKAIRRNGNVPAIVYGGSAEPELIELNRNEVTKRLANEAVYSHVLKLNVDGKVQNAILKDMQRHPAKDTIIHMDFLRINMNEKIKVHVPLHFINEETSLGVKAGGVVTHSMVELEVACLPANLPEYIEVDLEAIDIGGSVHLSDIVVPEGIELLALTHGEEHNLTVAQIVKTRAPAEDEEGAATGEDGEEEVTASE
ncbi:MAG: 50S ribosomal protein L25/general stress protein Ctc [Gammaproteobacteria bacterium]|jgi:large subunit ribosomal protein L25|nr:50S ribosomal protein L25/general stress protein Ctc [Gammaproteobacteria bacterium]MBT5827218.1 50S ribosomal protein L25/general stress protein Ctc [Gammaproteobacteria bacterium]MBT5966969.1 50S ribosomal protein L25/general stress protein Ctc [Gammaproteobacteria bacterium]MBT6419643.1 50S ribosomal protein L25/general stress protein Ctc [Gammaproteobacteria bacterium]MBT6576078.1 50S ribosomal protein L25/general stress protein Ctc [Gammaproteobacteria bacterium]